MNRRPVWCLVLAVVLLSPTVTRAQVKPFRGAEYRTIASMKYGRFEVRMRSAQVSGMLASFFTYYDPASPWNEIDIENMGRYSNEAQFNTIVPSQANNHVQRQILPFNPHAAFHVYAIEWAPAYVAWQVDGVEVYRQTGTHIGQLAYAQKLMMNVWQPSDVGWAGVFARQDLPVYAYYDWIKYYAYTPGVGDDFTLQWTDDLTAFDPGRWQRATHTWSGNNCQFVQENVAFQGGYMILCITDSLHSGYAGGPVVDKDIDPPYLISARASVHEIRVLFSERLDRTSAETVSNYVVPGVTLGGGTLLADGRTVSLQASGLQSTGSYSLIVFGVKDTAGNAMGAKSIKIENPLSLPVAIDVGGGPSAGYLADSVWSFSARYGAVGGRPSVQPSSIDIAGTSEDSVYRSALLGLASYKVRVPTDLTYNVTLMFSEPTYQGAGKRVFDVAVNNGAARRIDIFQQAGANTALQSTFAGVAARDGILSISFTAVSDTPLVCGIRIEGIPNAVNENRMGGGEEEGFGVYPNPFNGTTNVSFVLEKSGDVDLEIFDLLGRRVSVITAGSMEAGRHSFRWDAEGLASGAYLCSLRIGGEATWKRLLFLK